MPPFEKQPDDQDCRLLQEYGQKYLKIQGLILNKLPTEAEREDWAIGYGKAFHDLAAADKTFHDLVMSDPPDIQEIRRRVEEHAARVQAKNVPKQE